MQPILEEEVTTRHTFCQLCGYTPKDVAREAVNKWRIYTFNGLQGLAVFVVACPNCKTTHPMEALGIYQKRVLAGLDINFH